MILDTLLYTAIFNSRKRLHYSILKQKLNRPIREKILKYIRILSPLKEIPIGIDSRFKLFLDGHISANLKTGHVYQELVNSGIESKTIWHQDLKPTSVLGRTCRVLIHIPWLFLMFLKKYKTLKSLDLIAIQVFVGYEAYKCFFKRHKNLIPIIISDINPNFHMQWSGAKAVNREVFWWQDDYHHYKGFGTENYFPYPCDYAAVLNEYGLDTVKQNSPKAIIFKRKLIEVKQLRDIPDYPKIGIATNAFFEGSKTQFEMINYLRKKIGVANVFFRLHPSAKLDNTDTHPEWVKFANQKETLEDFALRIDIAIVGNSAVQLKFLCEGIPVVHISELDPFEFDLYGYCKKGFVYGIPNDIDSISLLEIKRFYQEKGFQQNIYKYVNVTTNLPKLKKLKIQ